MNNKVDVEYVRRLGIVGMLACIFFAALTIMSVLVSQFVVGAPLLIVFALSAYVYLYDYKE